MAIYRVQGPDGKVYKLEGPDGASEQDVISQAQALAAKAPSLADEAKIAVRAGREAAAKPKVVSREDELKRIARERVTKADQGRLQGGEGFWGGVGDFVEFGDAARASVANTFGIGPRIMAAFDDADLPYEERLAIAREENRLNRDKSITGDITGLVLGGGGVGGAGKLAIRAAQRAPGVIQRGANALDRATTLRQGERLKNAGKMVTVGAATGAGQAAGEGTDVGEGALYGGAGGAVGGYVGSKLEGALEWGVQKVSKMLPFVKGKTSDEALRIITEKLQQDGMSADDAARVISEAQARGVPLALGDTGENIRGLTSSMARKPGANRPIVMDAVDERQMAQAERIQGAIERDLGPVTYVRQASTDLMDSARKKAKPLYEEAYSAPVEWTKDEGVLLNRILNTPAGKKALQNAHTIAGNEMRDPGSLGFAMNDNGEIVLESVPTFQTLDYIKRGLDDVVNSYPKNAITGRPELDTNGKAVDQLRRKFVADLRQRNDKYREALDTYAGDASMNDALLLGQKSIRKSADDIEFETRDMTPGELEQYKLGVRSGLADFLEGKPDGANQVRALIGSPKKRAALEKLFGGQQGLANFLNTLKAEAETFATYKRSMTGSPTAINEADDRSADMAVDMVEAAIQGGNGNVMAMVRSLLRAKGREEKASEITRTELAKILTEQDPSTIGQILRQVKDEEIRAFKRQQRGVRFGASGGMGAARDNGGGSVPAIDVAPAEETPSPQSMDVSPKFDDLASRVEMAESGGDPTAVSPKGALNVMQVMPSTGPDAAALAGVPYDENRLRTDEAYGRLLGRAYLAEMLRLFGDEELALVAYNWGPNNLQKTLDAGKDWREVAPQETLDYVARIMG